MNTGILQVADRLRHMPDYQLGYLLTVCRNEGAVGDILRGQVLYELARRAYEAGPKPLRCRQ